MAIKSHEDLLVWQLAMTLATDVDALAASFPARERYGLAAQVRSAASSIPANIAEGWARSTRVYINLLRIALGSEAEVKTHLLFAVRTKAITREQADPLLAQASQIGRMLRGLKRSLHAHLLRTQP